MKPWMRILRLTVLVVIVGLFLWFGDLHALVAALSRSSVFVIVIALGLSVLAVALNAFKLQFVMPAASYATLLEAALISQFYSFFFLGQASGEASKIYLLSKASGNISGAAVSVFADRLTAFIGVLIVSVTGFAMSTNEYPPSFQRTAVAGLAILVIGLIALRHDAFFNLVERIAVRIGNTTPAYSVALAGALQNALRQWHISVRHLGKIFAGIAVGGLVHVCNVLTYMVLAYDLGIRITFFDWCWISGITSIAGLIPLTVGQVTAGGALVGVLRLLNVSLVDAVSLSVLVLCVNGLLALIGAMMEFRRVQRAAAPGTQPADHQ
jgi:hypothetical protein